MERVDILILGATGFTGKLAVKFLAKIVKEPEYSGITWGVSGRCKEKLKNLLMELHEMGVEKSKISVVECDITDQDSLKNATEKAQVLVNCTGPYTILGEPVVKSCLLTGTHYIDISAEIYQILEMYIKYNKIAEEQNLLILPACGWASVPASTALMYLEKHFKGTLSAVECYMELKLPNTNLLSLFNEHCLVHYGTWQSLVEYLKKLPQYIELKRETFPDVLVPQPKEFQRSFIHQKNKRFWFPYPGPDNDVVQMSQRYLKEKNQKRPVYYASFTTMPSLFHFIIIPIMYLYYYLCRFKCFRQQLRKHPRFYTFGFMDRMGPTEETRKRMKYIATFYGIGWDDGTEDYTSLPNKSLSVKVTGTDPGYQTTAVTLILSAITLILERSKMPRGGVIMPEAAYRDTNIIKRLKSNGMNYEVIQNI